jgi:hypothetical protein
VNHLGLLLDWHLFSELASDRSLEPRTRLWCRAAMQRIRSVLATDSVRPV